ncbi:MAG: RNA polymerase sigma factor [Bacteroidota bacterium]
MDKIDDQYYIQKVKAGQADAFRFLVERHKTIVFNIVLQITRNNEDTEEVAQDVFLKAYQSLGSFKGDSKFSTWLYRIAYNMAISKIRKKKIPVSNIDDFELADDEIKQVYDDFESVENLDKKKYLKKAIDQLSPEDSMIITLFYLNEHSIEEISELTDMGKSNVKVRLYRARKKMFEYLSKLPIREMI